MGMAASQAKLLSLTARLHDIELKAQNIQSQKIALATQKDELYQEYCEALDATAIKAAFWSTDTSQTYIDANFNSLCTFNDRRVKHYTLKNNQTGNLIVSEDVKNNYEMFGDDKYTFAYAMMGYDSSFGWDDEYDSGQFIGIGKCQDEYYDDTCETGNGQSLYMTQCERIVYENHCDDVDLTKKYNDILSADNDSDKAKLLEDFRDELYKKYASEIFEQMNYEKNESPEYAEPYNDKTWSDMKNEFNYYINLWTAIKEAGGCEVIDPICESGDEGNLWFNNMVEAGLVTIQVWDDTGARKQWSETSTATSTNQNYLQNLQNDKDLKKAEAKYEHELSIINKKDTKFDTELSNLETERTSIKTEMDAIKQVRDDNIDRTFGIFS